MENLVKTVSSGLLMVLIVSGLYSCTEGSAEGPEQPILFSHKVHAGENKIPCQYCHSYTEISSEAGIPSLQKCMGCHTQVLGRDVEYEYNGGSINYKGEIQKLTEYWSKAIPVPWKRVYYVPEYAHFTHAPHIRRGFECKTCHGEVEKMDVIHRVQELKMGWCVNCHEANARDEEELARLKDCFTCHY